MNEYLDVDHFEELANRLSIIIQDFMNGAPETWDWKECIDEMQDMLSPLSEFISKDIDAKISGMYLGLNYGLNKLLVYFSHKEYCDDTVMWIIGRYIRYASVDLKNRLQRLKETRI